METPPPRIRLTITVSPEVHEVYNQLAKAANMSLGRAMGDWLEDTKDAAQYSAVVLAQAKQAPKDAIRQLNATTAALVAQSEELTARIASKARPEPVRADRREHAPAAGAPSSLTGLNPPKRNRA